MALLTNINGKFSVSDVGAVTFNNAFTFPTTDGAANYVLQTNGSGQLAWALNGNGDISGSGTANTVTKFTGSGSGVKTIGNGPITFSGNNSTFSGDVLVEDNLYLTDAGTVRGKIQLNSSDRDNLDIKAISLGSLMRFYTADTLALTLNATQNATFAGTVTAPTFLGDLNGTINTVTTATTKGNSTNDTTVATTAFVQNVIGTIPAGLVFQGTWNAATNTPTLTSGSGITGNFYIVSVAGSTNLDGITDWQVGDWAVFIEQGASDQWEKIDNSSVLSGSGTGGSFAGWSGSGTSVTLGNAPVTFSGNTVKIPEYIEHLGDPDTYLGFPAANEFKVTVGGSTKIFADANSAYLYYQGVSKLQTTSTGAQVTGTNLSLFNGSSAVKLQYINTNGNWKIEAGGGTNKLVIHSESLVADYLTIKGGGVIQFNDYGAGTLITDASGNISVSSGGGAGGPYLPLSGGTLTGNVTLSGQSSPQLFLDSNTGGTPNYTLIANASSQFIIGRAGVSNDFILDSGNATFAGIVGMGSTGIYAGTAAQLNLPGKGLAIKNDKNGSGNNWSYIENTATGSASNINFYTGNNAAALTLAHNGNATFSGDVGIGAAPVGNPGTNILAVGTAGTTAGGIQLWAANNQAHYLQFGDANSGGEVYRGGIGYNHSSETLLFLQNSSTALSFTGSQAATFAGTISVASGTISVLGGNNMTLAGPASHGGISFATNSILPATAAATNDNVFDIGATTERFKDGYFGGTVTANNFVGGSGAYLPLAGGTMTGNIVMGDNDITGIDQLIFTSGTYLTDISSNYVELRYASTAAGGMIIMDGDGTTQGYLYADGGATSSFGLLHGSGSWAVRCKELAEVELRYNDSVKFATTNTGVEVTGDIIITSGGLNVGGNATVKNMLTINIDDISTGENRGLKLYNENSSGQQWNLTTGRAGQENTSFVVRDSSNNVDALIINEQTNGTTPLITVANGGNTTFAGNVSLGTAKILNFSGTNLQLLHDGSNGLIINNTGDLKIQNAATDKDIIFIGKDGASTITALTLDMSNGGSATFRDDIDFGGKLTQTGTGANTFAGDVTINGAEYINQIQARTGAGLSLGNDNNSGFVFIDDNSNVGISTTSPDFKLQIQGGTNTEETVLKLDKQVTGDTGGHTTILAFGTETGAWAKAGIGFERTGSYDRGKIHFLQKDTVNTDTATLSDSVMTILPSGNVGIGVIAPSTKLEVAGHVTINSPAGASQTSYGLRLRKTNSSSVVQAGGEILASVYPSNTNAGNLIFKTANASANLTQRMVIDGVGNVGIGNTSPQTTLHVGTTTTVTNQFTNQVNASNFFVNGNANGGASFFQCKTAAVNINMMGNNDFACNQFTFYHKPLSTSQNVVGTIATFSSSTQYNTTSDYRLKENVIPLSDSIIRLKQLKPSRFNFIEDPERTMDGFLAHEVQNTVPEAVNGEKDAVDENGNEVHQGIDQAKIVPLLVAAVQEQQEIIESLKQRIEQLEN